MNTANDAVLAEGRRVLIDDPGRFEGVAVIGVDEHVWRHTRRGEKYVTAIIDLTPVRDGMGPCRLLDMVEGRSKQAFKTWLAERPQPWREHLEVVAMDGFPASRPPPPRNSPTRPRSWTPSTSCSSQATPWTAAGAESSMTSMVTAGAPATQQSTATCR